MSRRKSRKAYELFIDENGIFMDEDSRRSVGRFSSYAKALAWAKGIVDNSLRENFRPGISAEALDGLYRSFGEDPFIVPTPEGQPHFSAWRYAKARAAEMVEAAALQAHSPDGEPPAPDRAAGDPR